MDTATIIITLAAFACVFLTLVWMGIHAWGLFRLLRLDDKTMSTKAMVAWGGSFLVGFTGPCVILLSIVTLVLGQQERTRARWGEASKATGVAAGTAVAASSLMLFMGLLLVVAVGLTQVMAG